MCIKATSKSLNRMIKLKPSNLLFFWFAFFWAATETAAQQLPLFSQYVFNSLHINPGYAGYKIDPFVQATYRSQYIDFPGAPKTLSVSGDMASSDGRMGFGASFSSDQIGATKTMTGLLTYAYKIQTGDQSFLSLGASAGVSEYALDGSQLVPDDATDPTLPTDKVNLFTPNLNIGLFFYNERFFTGLSAFNLIGRQNLEGKDIALALHHVHYYFQVGALFPLSADLEFKPSLLVREDLKGPTNFDVNAMFLFKERLWAGVSYRSRLNIHYNSDPTLSTSANALAAIVEVFATERLRVGYAFDYNLNTLNHQRNNSHEISVGLYFGSKGLQQEMLRCF